MVDRKLMRHDERRISDMLKLGGVYGEEQARADASMLLDRVAALRGALCALGVSGGDYCWCGNRLPNGRHYGECLEAKEVIRVHGLEEVNDGHGT